MVYRSTLPRSGRVSSRPLLPPHEPARPAGWWRALRPCRCSRPAPTVPAPRRQAGPDRFPFDQGIHDGDSRLLRQQLVSSLGAGIVGVADNQQPQRGIILKQGRECSCRLAKSSSPCTPSHPMGATDCRQPWFLGSSRRLVTDRPVVRRQQAPSALTGPARPSIRKQPHTDVPALPHVPFLPPSTSGKRRGHGATLCP